MNFDVRADGVALSAEHGGYMPDFDQMRADRVRWLAEIARVEAGNEPTVTHKELGELLEQPEEYVATLKRWVADNERHLADNNEPFDA